MKKFIGLQTRWSGYGLVLPNGLRATVYRLDNKKIKDVALACTHPQCTSSKPDGIDWCEQIKYYAVIVELGDKKIVAVTQSSYAGSVVRRFTDTRYGLFESTVIYGLDMMVYEGVAYSPFHPFTSILQKAILHEVGPNTCYLIYAEEDLDVYVHRPKENAR
jgi:hypothetical protein